MTPIRVCIKVSIFAAEVRMFTADSVSTIIKHLSHFGFNKAGSCAFICVFRGFLLNHWQTPLTTTIWYSLGTKTVLFSKSGASKLLLKKWFRKIQILRLQKSFTSLYQLRCVTLFVLQVLPPVCLCSWCWLYSPVCPRVCLSLSQPSFIHTNTLG